MNFTEKTIATKEIFNGKIINLRVDEVKLPDGKRSTREVVEHSGGVTILPVTDTGEIILVEQYRKPVEETLLELPAGKLEPGEEPLECAKRELREETGFNANQIDYLFSFYTTPGFSNEKLHLFLAKNLKEVGVDPDPDEIIQVHKLKTADIIEYIRLGKIKDGKTILGLLNFLRGDF